MPKPQRKTQAERRGESERSLLEAAVDVIAEQGVSAVTFEALGQATGFSRGLASQRFGSKQKLIEALLNNLRERQEVLQQERRLDELPGLEAISSYVELCLHDLQQKHARAYFMLLSSSVADASAMRDAFQNVHAGFKERLRGWVEKGQRENTIRSEIDPESAALMIGCVMFGTSMQFLVNPDMEIEAVKNNFITMLRFSLAQ